MKKFLLFCLIAISAINLGAQEHVKFLGIPMTGTGASFKSKLVNKGFKASEAAYGDYAVRGTYDGVQNCILEIGCTPKSKTTFEVSIYIPVEQEWDTILGLYNSYVDKMTAKYGEPDFVDRPRPRSPYLPPITDHIQAVKDSAESYYTSWKDDLGTYSVSMTEYINKLYIWVSFEDAFNATKMVKERD